MTKKLLILGLVLGLSSSMVFGKGWIVPASSLPQKSSAFISSNFPNAEVWMVEMKKDKIKVRLSNGVDVSFFMSGDVKDIKGNFTAIPFNALPTAVANAIKQNYPQAEVWSVKMKYYNVYRVRMNNFMELYIDVNGNILNQMGPMGQYGTTNN